ncbi:hypothetical protein A4R35_05300 [Thermogemmatispora tikiterensis]|uniref:Uncharacterized protein n=1 Tax=Thermogemmatispora tikiterensis TaxID=1825093 RepID=A0A328VFU8_9CHLR|nr:hypothetical protein A4R35_05300 [Thermogemmatispora tikiterensis]
MPKFCVTHFNTGKTRQNRERGRKELAARDHLKTIIFCELDHLTIASKRSNLLLQAHVLNMSGTMSVWRGSFILD